jgi:hypothetical protein
MSIRLAFCGTILSLTPAVVAEQRTQGHDLTRAIVTADRNIDSTSGGVDVSERPTSDRTQPAGRLPTIKRPAHPPQRQPQPTIRASISPSVAISGSQLYMARSAL